MAKKLIDQEETARLLGVSVDELNSMRDRKQIYPKRDGGVWKYTQDEIDRVLEERQSPGSQISSSDMTGSGGGGWGDSLSLEDVSLEINNDPDSILLDDIDIGDSSEDNPSTIIGGAKRDRPSESDINIAGHRTRPSDPSASDVGLVADLSSQSDVRLVSESGIGTTRVTPQPGGSGLLDDLVLEPAGGSDKLLGSGSLKLADDELRFSETDSDRRRRGTDHDTRKGGSAVRLAGDDDDLVLEGKSGSDITIGGDSGISLVDPHDSGLSLEEPLELESSHVESLDLGEDDMISLEEDVDLDAATQLKTDDDFLVTPMDDGGEESDSGSQVIALDADEDFESGFGSSPALLEEDMGAAPLGFEASPMVMSGGTMAPAAYSVETPYSVWNILALAACVLFLIAGGMFMYDLSRHLWSWGTPYTVNSSMMDSLIGMFEK